MSTKYPCSENFFQCEPKPANFWVWKCMIKNRDLFRQGFSWKVGMVIIVLVFEKITSVFYTIC